MKKTFTFDSVPSSPSDIKASTDPFETAAVVAAVLCNYKNDIQSTIEMLDILKGPDSVSQYEIQFLRDRLRGKEYKPYSFFKGASPANGYTPLMPLTVDVEDSPYSYTSENYATLYLRSSGADSPRGIRLRKKPSTGEWFLTEQFLLSDIRIPVQEDPWS
ncbi:MAG: hypothetical protein K6B52_00655 [Clostridiales bacterium]|nr:hypothetical protein [Clostridiales bacterium]